MGFWRFSRSGRKCKRIPARPTILTKFPETRCVPNGKLQQNEILKVEHTRELQEVHQLVELAQALQKELEQSGAQVLSISSLHRTEEIEKLARRIHSQIRGY